MLIWCQSKRVIVNTEKVESIYVQNEEILAESGDGCYVLGRYRDDVISKGVFHSLAESVGKSPMFVMPGRDYE